MLLGMQILKYNT